MLARPCHKGRISNRDFPYLWSSERINLKFKRRTDGAVSLRGAVEFDNVDAEPVDDLLPDLRTESVAEHDPDLVALLVASVGTVRVLAAEVSRHLPDVLGRLFSRLN